MVSQKIVSHRKLCQVPFFTFLGLPQAYFPESIPNFVINLSTKLELPNISPFDIELRTLSDISFGILS